MTAIALIDELKPRWYWACTQSAVRDPNDKYFDSIVNAYEEQGRSYHNLRHIVYVIQRLDELKKQTTFSVLPSELVFAAFWHDTIYDIQRVDNEERSAMRAEESLLRMGAVAQLATETGRIIRTSSNFCNLDEKSALLHDADFSPLGEDESIYYCDVEKLRDECAFLSDDEFKRRRVVFLKNLLAQNHIFCLSGQEEREKRARQNMVSDLARLVL